VQIDTAAWSGDGDFTIRLLGVLEQVDDIAYLRVEDAPASRSGSGYNLLANEIFLSFATELQPRRMRWLGLVPLTRRVAVPKLTLAALEARLGAVVDVGQADYADEGMLQYLRTHRVIQPYQTMGYKLVELVRIYEISRVPAKDDTPSGRD
jgi:hypothetical protein